MKEPYFTFESIDRRSREMLGQLEELRQRHRVALLPETLALLVLDMQRYFLDKTSHAYVPSAEAIVPRIEELLAAFSGRGLLVAFTRHLNSAEDAGRLAQWWQDLITVENPLSELTPELEARAGVVIQKSQYDAFYKTRLEEVLKARGVGQLVICGVMAHLCCETTARSAFVRGFEVLFTIDGTATYNEGFHRATLLNLAHGFAYPVLVEEVLAAMGKGDDG